MGYEVRNGPYRITTDTTQFDLEAIHAYLTASYWADGIPKAIVARSIEHSLCFGVFAGQEQIGLARVVTDRATYAYIGDVYILDAYRGQGLGKWLMATIVAHPDLQGLRRWTLATRDAHGLYAQFGFTALADPNRYMERLDDHSYRDHDRRTDTDVADRLCARCDAMMTVMRDRT
jgi:GNAT superfamily N-acetyltransferase